jgi:ATP synthase I chain
MATELEKQVEELPVGARALRNISRLTLVLGISGAVIAFFLDRTDWSKGLALGAILGWLNFRWLKRGVTAILSAPAQLPSEKARNPAVSAFLALFRYGLIGLSAYAIFIYLHVPLVSLAVGLCALGAATIAASVWEILRPAK